MPSYGTEIIEKTTKLSTTSIFSIFSTLEYAEILPATVIEPAKARIYNKLERNHELTSKKRLFHNMKKYYDSIKKDTFQYIPLTFHISKGTKDRNFTMFKDNFFRIQAEVDKKTDIFLNNC